LYAGGVVRRKAVAAGAAEYYIEDGSNKQFRWLPKKEVE
jgi:hypothetical protein